MLIEDSVRLARECRTALEECDSQRAYRAAHTLKGAAGNLCAGPLSEAAAVVEGFARRGDCSAARAACPALEAEIARVRPLLVQFTSVSRRQEAVSA